MIDIPYDFIITTSLLLINRQRAYCPTCSTMLTDPQMLPGEQDSVLSTISSMD